MRPPFLFFLVRDVCSVYIWNVAGTSCFSVGILYNVGALQRDNYMLCGKEREKYGSPDAGNAGGRRKQPADDANRRNTTIENDRRERRP